MCGDERFLCTNVGCFMCMVGQHMRPKHSAHIFHICKEERRAARISPNTARRRHASTTNISCVAPVLAQLLSLETGSRMCLTPVLYPTPFLGLVAHCGLPLRPPGFTVLSPSYWLPSYSRRSMCGPHCL